LRPAASNETEKKAVVRVPEDQLSLAIGKQGQNVRLAAKLTGWNIDIISADESRIEAAAAVADSDSKGGADLESSLIDAINNQAEPEGQADVLSGQEPTA
jgi:N utilization substance protein A